MRKQVGILIGCGLAAATLVAVNVVPANDAVAAGLVSFDTCPEVLDHLTTEADERVGPWGLSNGGGRGVIGGPQVLEESSDAAVSAPEGPSADAPGGQAAASARSFSTTNVQEVGVDEPDIVKTDGRFIVTTLGPALQVIESRGTVPQKIGELPLGGDGHMGATLLLSGERAMVFIRDYAAVADTRMPEPGYEQPTTRVLLVDLSNPADPVVESSLEVDGNYLDARLVDDTVRVVVSSAPSLQFPMEEKDWDRAESELTSRNRRIIAESTIEDWLPTYRLDTPDGRSSGQLVECDQLNYPPDFAGFSTISVLTLGFDGFTDGDAVGVLTDGDTVYSSSDQLYVATADWGEPADVPTSDGADIAVPAPQAARTGIHAFDISGDGPARYLASGKVDGQIIGRYAMSEHEGVLRIATTTNTWDDTASESQLVTFAEQGDELVQVGSIGGLGRGERIYAVRYFGDTAYVVTFRETDPLYAIDLSDPANPSLEGELKITGYSSYLHPLGEDRLIGIGQEATERGQTIGTQVSLFDVSDPAEPQKLAGHVTEGAWSDAESDPHAFLYWPETRQLVVPIRGIGLAVPDVNGEPDAGDVLTEEGMVAPESGGALVLGVDDTSLTEQGIITHGGGADRRGEGYYSTSITRSMVIEDSLYTLWYDGLQVNDLDDLEFQSWLRLNPGW